MAPDALPEDVLLVGVLHGDALLELCICFRYSLSSNIFLSPPLGLCFTLSKDPTLLAAFALKSSFSIGI